VEARGPGRKTAGERVVESHGRAPQTPKNLPDFLPKTCFNKLPSCLHPVPGTNFPASAAMLGRLFDTVSNT
jgi:hypothetical protein